MWRPVGASVSLRKDVNFYSILLFRNWEHLPKKDPVNASCFFLHPLPHPSWFFVSTMVWVQENHLPYSPTWSQATKLIQSLSQEPSKILPLPLPSSRVMHVWTLTLWLFSWSQSPGYNIPLSSQWFHHHSRVIHQGQTCKHHWHRACWVCHGRPLYLKDTNRRGVHYKQKAQFLYGWQKSTCVSHSTST